MAETFLMIVLTLLSNGQLSAAFSGEPTEVDCHDSMKTVSQILKKGGYEIKTIGCYRSRQSFSPYEHGVPDDQPREIYFIELTGEAADISRQEDLASCQAVLDNPRKEPSAFAYCATSIQTLLK